MGTLWNTYAFFVLYANIDNFDPTDYTSGLRQASGYGQVAALQVELHGKGSVMRTLANYRIPEAARALQEFRG